MSHYHEKKYKVIILGGGIHGVSIAYFLSTRFGISPLIVEQTGIACAASGKAGGFLAKGWGSGVTSELHEKSFELHNQLASQLHIESYRKITTLQVDGNRKGKNIATWLNKKVSSTVMDEETAQVTPAEFTHKLLEASQAAGTEILIDRVNNVNIENNEIKSIQCEKTGTIMAENIVIAMGPWSSVAIEDWFDIPLPMEGVKSTSLVFQNVNDIIHEPYAGFCAEDENGCHLELYPRTNGDLYICGCGGSDYVEGDRLRKGGDCQDATLVDANPSRINAAVKSFCAMSSVGEGISPSVTQACMRPCATDGLPVMGQIPRINGGFISTGHNCWGILWAPICGLAMAELIATGKCAEINLKHFSLGRFMTSQTHRGRKKGSTEVGEQW